MNPRYPVFIPTKGRYNTPLTIRTLEALGVPFHAVVQPQEYDQYAAVVKDPSQIITLPPDLDGLVPTRNWIWDYAQALGTPYFWTFDDNIRDFFWLIHNKKIKFSSGTFLYVIEDFIDRYLNMAICGMQYRGFAKQNQKIPPIMLNKRVYSNMLIRTNIPYRNRGVYNDDTDLCLRVLKDGWCTAEFNAFLAGKEPTMKLQGGNTPIYQGDGRLLMAQSLQAQHPDVVTITRKWGRWQHQVNYKPFKANRPILRPGVVIPQEPNNYGMVLIKREAPNGSKSTNSDL